MYNDKINYLYTVERFNTKTKTTIYMNMENYGPKANYAYHDFLDVAYDTREDDEYHGPSILASEEIEGNSMSDEMKQLLKDLNAKEMYDFDCNISE